MKVAKHVLLLLGLVGVLGVVMPFAELRKGPVGVALTAKELSFGLDKTHALLDRKLPKLVEKHLSADARDTRDDVKMAVDYLKWAVLAFAPAALLALIGLIAVTKGRLGRVLAGGAVFVGVIALGTWIGLHYAIGYALEEADVKGMTIELLSGAHMLLFTAATGIGVGIAAIVKPEPLPGPTPVRQPPSPMAPPPMPPPPGPAPTS